MALILSEGFENTVRLKLGIDIDELTNEELNDPLIIDLAEEEIIKRVPEYASISDTAELLFLRNAVVSYICYLVCPSMERRLNTKVTTLDTKWEKAKIDWEKRALAYLNEVDASLSKITSVPVLTGYTDAPIVGLITHDRQYIGSEFA